MTGNLVFHKQGQPASASDPSLAFSLASGQVLSYPDVITTMGTSGLGSLDVVTNGGAQPVVTARVFSDGGAAKRPASPRKGLSPREAIDTFGRGVLFTPEDPANFRMNIGVRTLDAGATLSITLLSNSGTVLATRTATYPANYFEQDSFATFTGVSTGPANGRINITIASPGINLRLQLCRRQSDLRQHVPHGWFEVTSSSEGELNSRFRVDSRRAWRVRCTM